MQILDATLNRRNFYPRPPRGGRRSKVYTLDIAHSISIHALREEGDDKHALVIKLLKIFLSTPSARRATTPGIGTSGNSEISIHALREEGDLSAYFAAE